jgi:hypothetical protein
MNEEDVRYALNRHVPDIEGRRSVEIGTAYGTLTLHGEDAAKVAKILKTILTKKLPKE